jgi:hypothetical protein
MIEMGDLRTAIASASDSELAELSAFLLNKFGLMGERIEEEGGWGWDLDHLDFVSAMREFADDSEGEE